MQKCKFVFLVGSFSSTMPVLSSSKGLFTRQKNWATRNPRGKKWFGPHNFTLVQIIIYRCSDKKWATDQVYTTHFGFRTHDGTSSAISELWHKLLQESRSWSRAGFVLFVFFFSVWDCSCLWPKPKKKTRDRNHLKKHDTHSLHGQKCEVRIPFFVRAQFFRRANGL